MDEKKFTGTPRQVADDMAAQIPKNFQEAFARVVTAGMRVMFSDETHDMMVQQLEQEGDFAENVGKAVAGLMLVLYEKSNKTMPQEVIVPAGIYLLGQGADFVEKVTKQKITPDIMGRAMQVMMDTLMEKFGIQPQRMYQAAEKATAGGYQ